MQWVPNLGLRVESLGLTAHFQHFTPFEILGVVARDWVVQNGKTMEAL